MRDLTPFFPVKVSPAQQLGAQINVVPCFPQFPGSGAEQRTQSEGAHGSLVAAGGFPAFHEVMDFLARNHAVDVVFCQHRLEDVLKCYDHIRKTNADMVVGARQNNESGSYRTLGKWVIRTFAASLLELPVKDLNSGMKCYRMSETLDYLDLCPDTMAYSDCILLLMVNDRKLVTETPIEIAPRTAGKSTIGTKTAIITLAEILNLAVLLRPQTTFCRLALIFLVLGIVQGAFTFIRSYLVTSTAVMLIVMGLLCFMLGLLCEQLSQIRRKLAKNASARNK